MQQKKFIIFGTGDFSDLLYEMIVYKLGREVACFCVDRKYITSEAIKGIKVVALEELADICSPSEHTVALGFSGKDMFTTRGKKFRDLKAMGYTLENLIWPGTEPFCHLGEGNIVFQNVSVGSFSSMGDGNVLWQGVVLPHHNTLGSFNRMAPSAALSGYAKVGNHCFLGNHSIVKNRVAIADWTLVGAGAYITEDTEPESVVVPPRSYPLENKRSIDFDL